MGTTKKPQHTKIITLSVRVFSLPVGHQRFSRTQRQHCAGDEVRLVWFGRVFSDLKFVDSSIVVTIHKSPYRTSKILSLRGNNRND